MRNHHKLEVFQLADSLALLVYLKTKKFPAEEKYGLTSQIRRAAVSTTANIVEGAARNSNADFVRMLVIASASACELEYELSLASRLGYLRKGDEADLNKLSSRTCIALRGLISAIQTD